MRTLDTLNAEGKRVLVRVDFNVPTQGEEVLDDQRIVESLLTLQELRKEGAKVILLSHRGRPKGERDHSLSLKPLLSVLERHLGEQVFFFPEAVGDLVQQFVKTLRKGEIVLLENIRFYKGEEANDPQFSAQLAALADVYVNDAFSVSHRAHASVEGVTHYLPSYAGRLMERELMMLERTLHHPQRPFMAIIGGAKISTKLALLQNLATQVDKLAVVGAMAHTFLEALGHGVGESLVEKELIPEAQKILTLLQERQVELILPEDMVVASCLEANVPTHIVNKGGVPSDQMILDAGPLTRHSIMSAVDASKTLIWNGALGITEIPPFDGGTVEVARHVALRTQQNKLVSVVGGGDTVSALKQAGSLEDFTYVSMAGGAFIEWVEGRSLPGVDALKKGR